MKLLFITGSNTDPASRFRIFALLPYLKSKGHDIEVFDEIVTSYHKRENLVIMMGVHNLQKIVNNLLSKNFPTNIG